MRVLRVEWKGPTDRQADGIDLQTIDDAQGRPRVLLCKGLDWKARDGICRALAGLPEWKDCYVIPVPHDAEVLIGEVLP